MNNELVFDTLDVQQIPVKAGNRTFLLKEASAGAVCQYQDAISASAVYNDKGVKTGHKGLADVESLLVSLCLVEVKDGGYANVSIDDVKTWPEAVKQKLYTTVCRMSNINQPDTMEELLEHKEHIEKLIAKLKADQLVPNEDSGTKT